MNEEGYSRKVLSIDNDNDSSQCKKSQLIFVPEVSVIQKGQAIFVITKLKGYVDGLFFKYYKI